MVCLRHPVFEDILTNSTDKRIVILKTDGHAHPINCILLFYNHPNEHLINPLGRYELIWFKCYHFVHYQKPYYKFCWIIVFCIISFDSKVFQQAKTQKIKTLEEWVLTGSAFKIQSYTAKNTLHHTAFSAILLFWWYLVDKHV